MASVSERSLSTKSFDFYHRPSIGTRSRVGSLVSTKIDQVIPSQSPHLRGAWFWTGRQGKITAGFISLPWKLWWKTVVVLSVIYNYIIQFMLAYYLKEDTLFLNWTAIAMELVFGVDVIIHLLNTLWPLARHHVRVYRRNIFLLIFDVFSLIPFITVAHFCIIPSTYYNLLEILARWVKILRVYRTYYYFLKINEAVHGNRKVFMLVEHFVAVVLMLHGAACIWYWILIEPLPKKEWYVTGGFPKHNGAEKLEFDNYISCWYYCACRLFNAIFGDSYPVNSLERWFTSILMLNGFIIIRYKFIGTLAWEMVIEESRHLSFLDQYHHMLKYLKFCGAPTWLIDQAEKYKQQLWIMKDGVLSSKHLQNLPLPLQMELIFDVNVSHFHDTLLFRNTGEAFMRRVSLLMKHQIYLAEQVIWSQGVVKNGMICVKRGVIEMLSDEDDESPMIAFKEGTVLGEVSLFYSVPSKVTVTAATYVELQVLSRTDFLRAMPEHRHLLENLRKMVEDRFSSTKKRQKGIEEYDKGDSRLIKTRYRPMKVLKDHLAGVEEEDPTFVDDSHMYYRVHLTQLLDENNIRQPKFTSEYLELYNLSPNVTTIKAPRICLKSSFPFILEPNSSLTHLFDVFHFILVLYVCTMTPYEVILCSSILENYSLQVIDSVVKGGLLFNIYIQLTTAVASKNKRKETVREIADVKMSTVGFYLDLLSVFPMHIFTDTLDPDNESISGIIARMFPMLQIWHLWNYMCLWEQNFNSNIKLLCLMRHTLILVISCYWTGSILYLWTCPRRLCRANSWMYLLIHQETKVVMNSHPKHERQILTSISFGTAAFTGTGYADIAPGANDLVLIVIAVTIGSYLSFFYIAKMCSHYIMFTRRRLRFKESMRELFYFLTVNHVSLKIKARVQKFFCVQWYYNNAVSMEELFKDMSSNIQQEVMSIEMVETLLFCPLFQQCSRDFLQTVAANTRSIVLPDNEIVQHAADIGRDMYILQKGHCNVLCNLGKKVMSLGPGSYFGDMEMILGLPKVYTVLTTTNCLLLHVEYTALVQSWSSFPDVAHPINVVLSDPELVEMSKQFEEAKPLTGHVDTKKNRIAQEIKDSFVVFNTKKQMVQYRAEFEKLGIFRYLRYFMFSGCITPHGIFLKIWCFLRFVFAIIYVVTIPYNLATKQHRFATTMSNLTDIFLYVDLFVMGYVAYYDDKSLLVTHPLLTMKNYLKRALLFDLLAVFPFELIFQVVYKNIDVDVCRVNRMLLVTRITGTFSYWESDIMRLNQAVVLLKFLPVALTVINLVTSFIFINSCTAFVPKEGYFLMVYCARTIKVSNSKYQNRYAIKEYLETFFWVFQMFVGDGCCAIDSNNGPDILLSIMMKITGCMYFALMFGYVTSTRSTAGQALLDHNEKTKDLANFLYQENVQPILTAKTMKYFEYVWKRTNGSNPQQICLRLNSALMEDTLVFMYEKTLREVPLFGNVERSFIRVITQHLSEMYFLKEETVIQCRDVQPYIYIIYRGKVDVLNSYNEMVTCMGPGGIFGNLTGQPISCSEVSVFASRSLDLLVIPSITFFNLVKYYPKIQEPLNKAFKISRDYIMPISMDLDPDSSEDSDIDLYSNDTDMDSKSGSSRCEFQEVALSVRASQSNISQSKSIGSSSVMTFSSTVFISTMFRPGSYNYQVVGYITCFVAVFSYCLTLYEIVTLNDCIIMVWIQATLDIYFYLKTHISMHQAYTGHHGDLVQDARKCRRHYFKCRLVYITDIIANFPLECFGFCFPIPQLAFHYFRMNKILRLKYLLEFYASTSAELTNNITYLQAIMTMLLITIFIHTFSCAWLIYMMACGRRNVFRPIKTFLFAHEKSKYWDYTASFYVVICQVTSTGGDENPNFELLSMAFLSIILILGKMVAAIVVASSTQVAYSSKHALTTYERETKELIDVLKNQGLSDYQLAKFMRYVQNLWQTERGRQLPALLAQTPYVRRCDLMVAMFGHHLRNCYIFADTGEPFLRQVAACLEYTIFFPGNYIVVAGDSEARMYWVSSGEVSVVSVRSDLTETTHQLLGPGDIFGLMQGLNRGVVHCFSYRAETKVAILALSADSWFPIIQYFPEVQEMIHQKSELLFTQI